MASRWDYYGNFGIVLYFGLPFHHFIDFGVLRVIFQVKKGIIFLLVLVQGNMPRHILQVIKILNIWS